MRGLVVCVVFLVLAPLAAAGAPAGFREARALEPAASWAAGKPVLVYCGGGYGEGGHAYPGSDTIYLSPSFCAALATVAAGRAVNGYALLTLAHEAMHASGITDESETECAAIPRVAGMAARFFGFKTWASRHYLMAEVWASHRRLPPDYQQRC